MDNGLWRTCLVCGNEFSSAFSDCPECHLKVGGTLYINLKPTEEDSYLKQAGNSVTVNVIEAIARRLT